MITAVWIGLASCKGKGKYSSCSDLQLLRISDYSIACGFSWQTFQQDVVVKHSLGWLSCFWRAVASLWGRKMCPPGVSWLVLVVASRSNPPPRFLFSQPSDNCFQGCSSSPSSRVSFNSSCLSIHWHLTIETVTNCRFHWNHWRSYLWTLDSIIPLCCC